MWAPWRARYFATSPPAMRVVLFLLILNLFLLLILVRFLQLVVSGVQPRLQWRGYVPQPAWPRSLQAANPNQTQTGVGVMLASVVAKIDHNHSSSSRQKQLFEPRTQGYVVPGCPCVRFGFDVSWLEQARADSLARWRVYPEWFIANFSGSSHSTCSHYSSQRGGHQRVISYSYYNPGPVTADPEDVHYRKYLRQLYGRARAVRQMYPGWIMRIYHNVSTHDAVASDLLCRIYCDHPHVDLCDVTRLPGHGNLVEREVVGRVWRFAVLGDPTVDVFLVRDSDSWILDREVAAVQEWLASGRGFHVMRDFPNHKAIMLAGLWGGHNRWPQRLRKIREDMFDQPLNLTRRFDQHLLATILWPVIKRDVLQHDSYNCLREDHKGSQPFPVRRKDGLYCGWGPFKTRERRLIFLTHCPKECRPHAHPKWTHC